MWDYVKAPLGAWQKLTACIRREDGSVTTEAVIIMPLLAAFYCATFVWFDAYRQKTLIMKASYAVSDVLSRQEEVDEPYLDDMRDVLDYMIPSNAPPRMRISLIRSVADANGDVDHEPNDNVVVTETAVLYQPIFRVGIKTKIYRNTIVTRPRFHPTLTKTDEVDTSTNFDDEDNDGDGDQVGTESDDDDGGASTDNGNDVD